MRDAPTTARTIASLFSGIGGLELGLERAGLGRVVVQVEQDERCRAVLARHWPEARRFDDVRTVGVREIGQVDVICGGFPCQDISLAGKGAGLAGERSGLWFEYLRIVKEVRPRVVIVENVAALRSRGLDVVLAGLHEAGYWTAWDFIHASDVGAPHRRKRLFIVAVADASRIGRDGREVATAGDVSDRCSTGWDEGSGRVETGSGVVGADVADAARGARLGRTPWDEGHAALEGEGRGGLVADARRDGLAVGAEPDLGPVEPGQQAPLGRDALGRDATVADADGERGRGGSSGREHATDARQSPRRKARPEPGAAEPGVGRMSHGVPAGMDGVARFARAVATEARWPCPPGVDQHPWEPPRTAVGVVKRGARLKALGNAVLPQVAEAVGRWAMYLEPQARQRRAA